jgi:putative ABC transport system permease protein
MTISAIAIGAIAIVLFGGFVSQTMLSFQTSTMQRTGHLSIFHAGYFDFGAGNPGAYAIADYAALMKLIEDDKIVGPSLRLITPTVHLFGVAGNFQIDASKTFSGAGVVPGDRDRMRTWDEYGVMTRDWSSYAKKGPVSAMTIRHAPSLAWAWPVSWVYASGWG